jgi:hypothetical protein
MSYEAALEWVFLVIAVFLVAVVFWGIKKELKRQSMLTEKEKDDEWWDQQW